MFLIFIHALQPVVNANRNINNPVLSRKPRQELIGLRESGGTIKAHRSFIRSRKNEWKQNAAERDTLIWLSTGAGLEPAQSLINTRTALTFANTRITKM